MCDKSPQSSIAAVRKQQARNVTLPAWIHAEAYGRYVSNHNLDLEICHDRLLLPAPDLLLPTLRRSICRNPMSSVPEEDVSKGTRHLLQYLRQQVSQRNLLSPPPPKITLLQTNGVHRGVCINN